MRVALPGRLVSLVLSLSLLLPATALARDFEKRVPAGPGGRLRVDLDVGAIEVEGHDEDEVRVEASASGFGEAMEFSLESRDGGREVSFRGRRRGVIGWISPTRVNVHIRVPHVFSVELRTSGGDVEVEGIEGAVEARTSGGEVTASEIRGPVVLRTSGGPVQAEQIRGDVTARTSGGEVSISEVRGRVDAETSGGPMEVHEVSGPVRVRTSGGAISVRFDGAPAGEIRTSGGPIDLEIPEGLGLRLDAETSGGGIELDLPVELVGEMSRNRVKGLVNGGGELLQVRTSGGPIRIQER